MRRASRSRGSKQSGLTVLECAAALVVAALVLETTARVQQACATIVRRARLESQTTDLARDLLEHELGCPCAASYACPEGYRCSLSRSPVSAAADRVTAHVEQTGGDAAVELATLAPVAACGG